MTDRDVTSPFLVLLGVLIGAGGLYLFQRSGGGVTPEPPPAREAAEEGAAHEHPPWTCSMHPQVQQPDPGKCPLCGMDLIPMTADAAGSDGPTRVTLSPRAKALAGLRTTPVERLEAPSAKRLLGRVEADETTQRAVTAWTGGRIERLLVDATGVKVKAGQVIARLYSPEIFAAHQDLLVAQRQVERLAKAAPSAQRAAEAALEAARERLRLLGISRRALAHMAKQEKPARAVSIRTPFAGTIIERLATEGAYVDTGTPLYRVADLDKLWLQIDAYERDLPGVSVGQAVEITFEALPGERFEGEIGFIDPTIHPQRRTARLRVPLDNPDGRLKPGMFAEITLAGGAGGPAPLVIPDTAPLFTGRRAVVYVEDPEADRPTYSPRVVRLGARRGEVYPVIAGLAEGERVVTRGAFTLDADLQLRGGSSMMTAPDDTEAGPFDELVVLPPEARGALAPVARHYLEIQRGLAADALAPSQTAARALAKAISKADGQIARHAPKAWPPIARALRAAAGQLASAPDIERARAHFEGLSEAMSTVLTRLGNPLDTPLFLTYCPMAFDNRGAAWVQDQEQIDNAYFGSAMRRCGVVKQHIDPGGYLSQAPASQPGAP